MRVFLEGMRDRRLAGRWQTGHPDHSAALPEHLPALVAFDLTCVPRHVRAGSCSIPVPLLAEGHDAVFGLRARRQDSYLLRKLPSLLANWLIRKVTGVQVHDMGCTLRVLRRDLAEALPLYGELHRFVPVLLQGRSYDDGPLPIGEGQTISQPFIVAWMTELIEPLCV